MSKKSIVGIKKFSGKNYRHWQNSFETKSLAQKEAKRLRENDYLVRIVEAPKSKGRYYSLYIRKKRGK